MEGYTKQRSICLLQNKDIFEYDIRSLLYAFFPQIKIIIGEKEHTPILKLEFLNGACEGWLFEEGKTIANQTTECDLEDKDTGRNQVKRMVYNLLVAYTGRKLAWGTLTGIRPVKIASHLYEQQMKEQEIIFHFMETYLTSEQKARLCYQVAKKEDEILKAVPYHNQFSLYVGIPFCPSRCLYCSFTSYPISLYEGKVEDYLQALFKEIEFVKQVYKNKVLTSIYIGGGTPTSLSAPQLERLLDHLNRCFDLNEIQEITVEAGRPDSITRDKLKVLSKYKGIRISINPQTMNQKTLDLIGRKHTIEQVEQTFYLARELGFSNINMDMIVGLMGECLSDIEHTLKKLKRLNPDSLTVHSLAIKRAANLNIKMEEYKDYITGTTNEMLELVDQFAGEMGLSPYYLYHQKNIPGNLENIGYAKEGKACLYNILIMEEKQSIVAVGAGGATKLVDAEKGLITRVENVKDVDNYITRIDEMIGRKKESM